MKKILTTLVLMTAVPTLAAAGEVYGKITAGGAAVYADVRGGLQKLGLRSWLRRNRCPGRWRHGSHAAHQGGVAWRCREAGRARDRLESHGAIDLHG